MPFKGKDYREDRFLNYAFGLSAYVDDLFIPFVNYSKTHRAPNIKEVYFSEIGPYGTNPDLKPETARTLQIGFNSFKDGIFSDDDKFRFKFLTYKTKIEDYIYNVRDQRHHKYYGIKDRRGRDYLPHYFYPIIHDNYHKDVEIKGLEIELSYDIGWLFANLSYAYQKTNQPLNFTDGSPNVNTPAWESMFMQGHGLTKLSMPPRDYATIELGTRLYKEKLTIGMIAKYYGKSRITNSNPSDLMAVGCPSSMYDANGNPTTVCGYTKPDMTLDSQGFVFDIYTIFKPTKNLTIKAEIQNLFDKAYINPLDSNNDSASQFIFDSGFGGFLPDLSNYARDRTALVSFSYQF